MTQKTKTAAERENTLRDELTSQYQPQTTAETVGVARLAQAIRAVEDAPSEANRSEMLAAAGELQILIREREAAEFEAEYAAGRSKRSESPGAAQERQTRQLVARVSESLHREAKMVATLRGETVTDLIEKAVRREIKR